MNRTEELLIHYLTPKQLTTVVHNWDLFLSCRDDYVRNVVVGILRYKYSEQQMQDTLLAAVIHPIKNQLHKEKTLSCQN